MGVTGSECSSKWVWQVVGVVGSGCIMCLVWLDERLVVVFLYIYIYYIPYNHRNTIL